MQETQETRVPSLGQEDPLGKAMAIRSSILAWRNPRTEQPRRLIVHVVPESQTQLEQLSVHVRQPLSDRCSFCAFTAAVEVRDSLSAAE